MISNILTVAQQVAILFVLIGIGAITNKTKIFDEFSIKKVTDLMLYVVTPAVIINSFHRELDMNMLKGLVIVFIGAIAIHIINIICCYTFIRDADKAREKVLRMSVVFSNCGYMSFPLQEAILGSDGVFFGAAYVAVFNIMLWTFGEWMMNGGGKITPKKIILNPGILGSVVGIIIFFTSFHIPVIIAKPIEYLASLNTPVAMLIVGFHLANASFRIKGANEVVAMFLRLIVSPAIMILGLVLFKIHGDVLIVCAIAASAPVAAGVTMFANKYDADVKLSATMTSLSTIISIITMPVIVGIAQYI